MNFLNLNNIQKILHFFVLIFPLIIILKSAAINISLFIISLISILLIIKNKNYSYFKDYFVAVIILFLGFVFRFRIVGFVGPLGLFSFSACRAAVPPDLGSFHPSKTVFTPRLRSGPRLAELALLQNSFAPSLRARKSMQTVRTSAASQEIVTVGPFPGVQKSRKFGIPKNPQTSVFDPCWRSHTQFSTPGCPPKI